MSDDNRHYCRDIEMNSRVSRVEQRATDLSDRLNRMDMEVEGLKAMVDLIRIQINKLELRLVVAVVLATLAPDLLMKVIGFFG